MEKQIVVALDDFGQPGKSVTMRNPQLMSWRQLKELRAQVKDGGDESGVSALRSLVVSWDADDASGSPLPPLSERPEAIEDLPLAVLMRLLREMNERIELAVPKGSATQSPTT